MTKPRKIRHLSAPGGCPTGITALYRRGDVVHAVPSGAERLAHVVYTHPVTRKTYSGDIFVTDPQQLAGMPTTVDLVAETVSNAQIQIVAAHTALADHVRTRFAHDLRRFVGDDDIFGGVPVRLRRVEIVDHVAPTKLLVTRPVEIVECGKPVYHPGCILHLCADSSPWCGSCLTPDGYFAPSNRCAYCYGAANSSGFPAIHSASCHRLVWQIQRGDCYRAAEGKQASYLRLGEKTDFGHVLFREQLVAVLEACLETRLRPIFPTKWLGFSPQIAALLKRSGAVLMPSLGCDDLEPGAVLGGRTQVVRIEDGIRYEEAGVITVPFVLADTTRPNGGPWFEAMVLEARRRFRRIQFVSLRLRSKDIRDEVFGDVRAERGEDGGLLYQVERTGRALPARIHPSIAQIVGDNTGDVRLCSDSCAGTFCGKCFVPGEVGTVTGAAPATVLAPLAKVKIEPEPPIISANIRGRGRPS